MRLFFKSYSLILKVKILDNGGNILNNYLEIRGGKDKYEVVSFLRGFSIFTIVIMHMIQIYIYSCPKVISKASALGGTGVHVFFFCSGFGLYLSQIKKPTGYFHFLKKRFRKIYVPYIIIILISAMIPFMYEGNRVKALISHMFLYKMFVREYEASFGVQFWYISTLVQFYLFFIPLCRLKEKQGGRRFCLSCCTISVLWWIFLAVSGLGTERIWNSFFLQYLWEFAIGMEIANKLEKGIVIRIKKIQLLTGTVAGLGVASEAVLLGDMFKIFNDVPALIGYGAVALLLYSIGNNWLKKAILFFSEISYELYLVHILIFTIMFRIFDAEGIWEYVIGVVSLLFAVTAASLYHWCIGEFSMRLKVKYGSD